jgi:hypothetical protein
MAYTKGLKGGKFLRQRFSTVSSIDELEDIAAEHLESAAQLEDDDADDSETLLLVDPT